MFGGKTMSSKVSITCPKLLCGPPAAIRKICQEQ